MNPILNQALVTALKILFWTGNK